MLRREAAGTCRGSGWLKPAVDSPLPADTKVEWSYWLNRGRMASLEGRKTDALAFYQKALFTRPEAPQLHHGRLKDDVLGEARILWKDTAGAEAAWAVWSTVPAGKPEELAEG